jgi:hypothetical protein
MGISRLSLKIEASPGLLKILRAKSKEERRLVGRAIDEACTAWGRPHLHAGSGLRKLRNNLYEVRSGLKTRLVFEPRLDGSLYFHTMGNHDEVLKFLKAHR